MQHDILLLNISRGDEAAFREFYALFKDKVYNTCLVYLQNVEEAEEATQDVFVEIHRSAGKFAGNAAVSTWVYRVTVNKCIDRIRHAKRSKRFAFISRIHGDKTGAGIQPGDFDHPGIQAENRQQAAILFRAINTLAENQRTAFILKQSEGLSQKEVALVMGISEKAVESLIQRAKANLRKTLKDILR